jgi:hypothetical protein
MAAADRVRFVMQVLMRMAAAQGGVIRVLAAEMKQLRLVVVDPNDGVIVSAHRRRRSFFAGVILRQPSHCRTSV